MENVRDIILEFTKLTKAMLGNALTKIILYGSVARGDYTENSDIDIMVLIDGNNDELRRYDDKLSDVSTDFSLKYLKVLSVIDISYQEYEEWRSLSPFYKNVSEEGVILYAA